MRTTELGASGIRCTVLGFGCATLLGSSGRRASLRALAAAWDSGITLYDTARSYGGGESEALLGDFLKGRRQQAVISTKFGIIPPSSPLWKRLAKPIVRTAMSAFPFMRSAISQGAARQYQNPPITVALLEESIHTSLRKLKTDYVDVLFLHGPQNTVLDQDDLLAAMENLVTAGKVRAAGISADPYLIGQTLERRPRPLRVLQFPGNLFEPQSADLVGSRRQSHPREDALGALANNPFGGITGVHQSRKALVDIAAMPAIDPALREKLGAVDDAVLSDAVLSDVVLNVILSRPGVDAVIAAMMKVQHLQKNVAAVTQSRFSPVEINELRNLITRATAAQQAAH